MTDKPPLGDSLTLWLSALPMVLMSIMGGLVHFLNGDRKKITLCNLLVQLLTSGFVGLLLYYLTVPMNICEPTRCFLAGIAGGCANHVLTLCTDRFVVYMDRLMKKVER